MLKTMRVFAPGKLFVIGEYAVLAGGRALVAALDAGIRCDVEPDAGKVGRIVASDLGVDLPVDAGMVDPRASLLASAAVAAARDFDVRETLRYHVFGARPAACRKIGLGGSAASVVAVVAATAAVSGEDLASHDVRERIFATARRVHVENQGGQGSGADVAASVFGGWLDYALAEGSARIRQAKLPNEARIAAAFSGFPSDTRAAIGGVDVRLLREPLDRFWWAIEHDRRSTARDALCAFGDALHASSRPGPGVDRVREFVAGARAAGAAAKGSGAIGGDCAIAFGFESGSITAAETAWRRLGAEVLDVHIDRLGVRREECHG
jgi:phosphomevalonate kinase